MAKFLTKRLYIYDPHEALISLLENQDKIPVLSEGNLKEFRSKVIMFFITLFILRAGTLEYLPGILEIVLVLAASYLSVEILIRYFRILNKRIRNEGITGLSKSTAGLFVVILVLAIFF